jgi:Mrp family chromosome partitioning ATPase
MKQIGSEAAIETVQENLHVLSAGTIPPNSLAIIDSSRMAILVEEFSQVYDLVIFDTPPLILVSDVLALGKMVDGILLVARPGTVDFASATAANELLAQSKQEVLGLVVNGIIEENEPNSYLRHSEAYYKDMTVFKLPLGSRISNFLYSSKMKS